MTRLWALLFTTSHFLSLQNIDATLWSATYWLQIYGLAKLLLMYFDNNTVQLFSVVSVKANGPTARYICWQRLQIGLAKVYQVRFNSMSTSIYSNLKFIHLLIFCGMINHTWTLVRNLGALWPKVIPSNLLSFTSLFIHDTYYYIIITYSNMGKNVKYF